MRCSRALCAFHVLQVTKDGRSKMSKIFRRVCLYGALPAWLWISACGDSGGGDPGDASPAEGGDSSLGSDEAVQNDTATERPMGGVDPASAGNEGQSATDVALDGASEGAVGAPSDPLLVQTADGPLRGTSAPGVDRFLGIPYAAPP